MLAEEGFDTIPVLSASRKDIKELKMKKRHTALVQGAVTVLQSQHVKGSVTVPACQGLCYSPNMSRAVTVPACQGLLQSQHVKRPPCEGLPQDSNNSQRQNASSGSPDIITPQLLESLMVKEQSQGAACSGGCLHSIDFILSSILVEVALGGGVTLKLNTNLSIRTSAKHCG